MHVVIDLARRGVYDQVGLRTNYFPFETPYIPYSALVYYTVYKNISLQERFVLNHFNNNYSYL